MGGDVAERRPTINDVAARAEEHMRARRLVLLIGASLGLASGVWRTVHRIRRLPYPFWMAVTPFTDWLYGTKTILGHLDVHPGQHVLEIGPGLGRLLLPVAARVAPGGDVTGVEIDHGIAQALRERAVAAGITNITVIDGDAAARQIPIGYFDVAYLAAVLGEIGNPTAVIHHLHDALKPGGMLFIIEGWPDPHHQSLAAVKRRLVPAGFARIGVTRAWGRFTAQIERL